MILDHTPLQIAVAAIPTIAWFGLVIRRPKTVGGWAIGFIAAYTVTVCAGFEMLRISK